MNATIRCLPLVGLMIAVLFAGCNDPRIPPGAATPAPKPSQVLAETPAPPDEPAQPAAPQTEAASNDDADAPSFDGADDEAVAQGGDDADETEENQQAVADNEEGAGEDLPDAGSLAGEPAADGEPADPFADFPRERFVLLAPDALLLVEVILSIDGLPHVDALGALVDRVLDVADTNDDGRPTWDEVAASATFRAGLFGNQPLANAGMIDNMKRLYDIDNDGVVDADEVPRFVTRNIGGSRAFSLMSANYNRDHNRLDSPIRRLIDFNQDGMLSSEEIAAAAVRVRSFDADGDDILYPVDFAAPSEVIAQVGRGMQLRRGQGPPTAVHLSPATNWGNLLFSLEELYAYGGALEPDSFSVTPTLFGQLDEDESSKIDRDEIKRLALQVKPHITLAAHFGDPQKAKREKAKQQSEDESTAAAAESEETEQSEAPVEAESDDAGVAESTEPKESAGEESADENSAAEDSDDSADDQGDEPADAAEDEEVANEPPLVRLAIVEISDELSAAAKVTRLDLRISLQFPSVEIEFYMNDAAGVANLAGRAQGLLRMYDGNNDGYLEEDEIPENAPGLAGDFDVIDTDGDGKAYPEEIENLLSQQQAAGRSQIRTRAYDREDALFTALDVDNDGRLNAREIDRLGERLLALDTSGDGHLATYEIPASIAVGFARGDPNQGESLFRMPAGYGQASDASAPKWFLHMDANADGDLSSNEFLGEAETFDKLDANSDGYVDSAEARAASS